MLQQKLTSLFQHDFSDVRQGDLRSGFLALACIKKFVIQLVGEVRSFGFKNSEGHTRDKRIIPCFHLKSLPVILGNLHLVAINICQASDQGDG
jgi:hypothetical protein